MQISFVQGSLSEKLVLMGGLGAKLIPRGMSGRPGMGMSTTDLQQVFGNNSMLSPRRFGYQSTGAHGSLMEKKGMNQITVEYLSFVSCLPFNNEGHQSKASLALWPCPERQDCHGFRWFFS